LLAQYRTLLLLVTVRRVHKCGREPKVSNNGILEMAQSKQASPKRSLGEVIRSVRPPAARRSRRTHVVHALAKIGAIQATPPATLSVGRESSPWRRATSQRPAWWGALRGAPRRCRRGSPGPPTTTSNALMYG